MKRILLLIVLIGTCLYGSGQVYGDYSVQSQSTKKGKSYLLLNSKGKTMISSSRTILFMGSSKFCVFDDKTSKYGVFDCTMKKGKGGYLAAPEYDDIERLDNLFLFKVTRNDKVGLLGGKDGSLVLEVIYDDIDYSGVNGIYKTIVNNKVGLFESDNFTNIIDPSYDSICYIEKIGSFKVMKEANGGEFVIKNDSIYEVKHYSCGLLDRKGRIVLPVVFSSFDLLDDTELLLVKKPGLVPFKEDGIWKKNENGLWEPLVEDVEFSRFFEKRGHYLADFGGKKQLINPKGQICFVEYDNKTLSGFDVIKAIVGINRNETDLITYYYWVKYNGYYGVVKDVWDYTTGSSLLYPNGRMELVEPFIYTDYSTRNINVNKSQITIYQLNKDKELLFIGPCENFGNNLSHVSLNLKNGERLVWSEQKNAFLITNDKNEVSDCIIVQTNDSKLTFSTNFLKAPDISSLTLGGKPLSYSDSFFKRHGVIQYPTQFNYKEGEIEIKGKDSNIYTYACPYKTDDISFFVKDDDYSSNDWLFQTENGSYLKYSCNSFYLNDINENYDISRISPSYKQAESFIPISYFRKGNSIILLHVEQYIGKPVNVVYTEPAYIYVFGQLQMVNSGVHYTFSEPKVSYLTTIDEQSAKPSKRITLKGFNYPRMFKTYGYIVLYNHNVVDHSYMNAYEDRVIKADKNNPIYLLTEDMDVKYMIYPNEDDIICDFCMTEDGIIMVGNNSKKGYVGYHNPVIYFYSFKSNKLISIPDKRQQKDSFIANIEKTNDKNIFELTYIDNYDERNQKTTKEIVTINYEDYK